MFLVLKLNCSECGGSYTFKGKSGLSINEPTTSPDGETLRIPLEFPGVDLEDPEFDDEDVH